MPGGRLRLMNVWGEESLGFAGLRFQGIVFQGLLRRVGCQGLGDLAPVGCRVLSFSREPETQPSSFHCSFLFAASPGWFKIPKPGVQYSVPGFTSIGVSGLWFL